MLLAKEIVGREHEEKGHIFMKTVLNFETKRIDIIVRRSVLAFMF
jgi:hypothetical protein